MKYLKKFNESKRTESDILIEFKNWIIENIKYTDDDILYYFSEFTDTHEWEFDFQLRTRSGNFILSLDDIFYIKNHCIKILNNSRVDCYITFTKDLRDLNSPETFIQLGEELKLFNVGYNQFKNLEEDIERINCKVDNSTFPITIEIEFERVIPTEIIQKFKGELDNIKEEVNKKRNYLSCNFCDGEGSIPCEFCEGEGCEDCVGEGSVICPECLRTGIN